MVPDKPTALARVTAWMADLLLALEYAHSRGVVHRDVKPANLLITSHAQVKVSDFGIARIESSTLTQTGSMIGTPSYMSPEQFRGETADARSDVFSSGVLLYQLLTGARPFVGSSSTVMHQILNAQPAPPSILLPTLGNGFDAIVGRALAKAPQDRYQSAREFLDALGRVGEQRNDAAATTLADNDRTVLAAGLHWFTAPQGSSSGVAPGSTGSGSGTSSTGTLAPWQREAFPELESMLSRQIGPMAKLLLKKAATKAEGIEELGELLLPHIPSELGRVQFQQGVAQLKKKLDASGTGSGTLNASATLTGVSGVTALSTPGSIGDARSAIRIPVTYDEAWAEVMTQRLTVIIGPIARVVAKRAARQTGDRIEFLQLLAAHIDGAAERTRFLAFADAE
jgi:serine/threonine-protein kinase